jgi:thioester reductase-like protein
MNLFITGATGYLGQRIVPLLSKSHDHLYLLVRKRTLIRAKKLFSHLENVTFVKGDLTNPDLIEEVETNLPDKIDSILHMGAFYDLQGDHKSCFLQNVMGTSNVLFFAKLCKNLKSFHYVSTIAVSGEFQGKFTEKDFKKNQSFSNPYAETKYEAERMVRRLEDKGISVVIYRPGIIIGDSQTGEFDKVDGPYYFWKTLSNFTGLIPGLTNLPVLPLPINENATLPIVCVDTVSNLIHECTLKEDSKELKCYHLVNPKAPKMKDLIEYSLKKFKIKAKIMPISNHPLIGKSFDMLGLPKEIIHYMVTTVDYDLTEANKDLNINEVVAFDEVRDTIVDFAIKKFKERK